MDAFDPPYVFLVFVQVDEQLALLQHEKVDLLKRLEEDQEDLNELMKKHKALIAQVLDCNTGLLYGTRGGLQQLLL